MAQARLELPMELRMTLNFQSFSFCLPGVIMLVLKACNLMPHYVVLEIKSMALRYPK